MKNVGLEVSSTITGNIPDTHQRLAQKCCTMCVVVWLHVSPGEIGAYLIFLTGLRLAALNVRRA